ncbi:DUF397 domain-containing protein [Streptomyces sp. NPDC058726]|uniref:DUF397 domain-containing protein n=1 Tax=Streptomyces sp. NPDC058726 TaxID=3346611 RepID=UPI00367F9363
MPGSHQDTIELDWFKSSHSGGNATECVECAITPERILVRDTKDRNAPAVGVGRSAWALFVLALKDEQQKNG